MSKMNVIQPAQDLLESRVNLGSSNRFSSSVIGINRILRS